MAAVRLDDDLDLGVPGVIAESPSAVRRVLYINLGVATGTAVHPYGVTAELDCAITSALVLALFCVS
jgi:hypothetical protein